MTSLLDKSTPVPKVVGFHLHNFSTKQADACAGKSYIEKLFHPIGTGGRRVDKPISLKRHSCLYPSWDIKRWIIRSTITRINQVSQDNLNSAYISYLNPKRKLSGSDAIIPQNQSPTIDYCKCRCALNCFDEESQKRVFHRSHSTRIRTHSTKRNSQSPATFEEQLDCRKSFRWDQCLGHKIYILKNPGFFEERPSQIQGTYPYTCKITDYSNNFACCSPVSCHPSDHEGKITVRPRPQDNPQAVKSVAGINFKSIQFQEPIL